MKAKAWNRLQILLLGLFLCSCGGLRSERNLVLEESGEIPLWRIARFSKRELMTRSWENDTGERIVAQSFEVVDLAKGVRIAVLKYGVTGSENGSCVDFYRIWKSAEDGGEFYCALCHDQRPGQLIGLRWVRDQGQAIVQITRRIHISTSPRQLLNIYSYRVDSEGRFFGTTEDLYSEPERASNDHKQ